MYVIILYSYLCHVYFGFVPSFVDKAATVGEESAVDGVEDGKFTKSLHGEEQHETNNHKADELDYSISNASIAMLVIVAVTYHTARATIVKRLTRPNEETSTDGTT